MTVQYLGYFTYMSKNICTTFMEVRAASLKQKSAWKSSEAIF